jgi:hypothetical protein
MIKYKLTDQNNMTFNKTVWGEDVTHKTNGKGELCGPGWLHYYHSPELAVLLNPIHADIRNPKLWECEAEDEYKDDMGLKGGCTKLTTVREIPLPEFSTEQKVKFAIYCTLETYREPAFVQWANKWLDGSNRTAAAARAAAAAHAAAARAAAAAATYAAAHADAAAAAAAAHAAADAAADAPLNFEKVIQRITD